MSYAYLFKYIIIGDTGKFIIVFFILLSSAVLEAAISYTEAFPFPNLYSAVCPT